MDVSSSRLVLVASTFEGMAIIGSYENWPDLGLEALVFLDSESDACFQIQRDLEGPRAAQHAVSTGMSAPIAGGVVQWRRVPTGLTERFEFELTRRAAALFADDVLSFDVEPAGGQTIDELAAHVDRLLS